MFDSFNSIANAAPWWSDLGKGVVVGPTDQWSFQFQRYINLFKYYSGAIFEDRLPVSEAQNDGAPALVQPVGLNISKLLCVALSDALFGEWEDRSVDFEFDSREPIDDPVSEEDAARLKRFWNFSFDENEMDQRLWEVALDQNRYGGGVLKVKFDIEKENGLFFERIDTTAFYPIWHPDDHNKLIECYVAVLLPGTVAQSLYGYSGGQQWVNRIEHWTLDRYETRIGQMVIGSLSGKNPYGIIPFEYIPRFRSSGYYGESVIDDIYRVSDEVNMRIADIGESLNYNTHPIRFGYNLPANFNQSNYPLSASVIWNFGRVVGANEPPKLDMLESRHPVPVEAFRHVEFLYDWAITAAGTSAVSFGKDEGSQRSGATLALRMWPLVRAIKRSRMYNGSAYKRLMDKGIKILEAHKPNTVDPIIYNLHKRTRSNVMWSQIIPRARIDVTNEIVQRMSTTPQLISLETALKMFGDMRDVPGEITRIEEQQKTNSELEMASNNTGAAPASETASQE